MDIELRSVRTYSLKGRQDLPANAAQGLNIHMEARRWPRHGGGSMESSCLEFKDVVTVEWVKKLP